MNRLAICLLLICQVCIFAKDKQIEQNITKVPPCTLLVKTDNGETLTVWINGIKIGKTPIQIDTLRSGFYDVSFLKPSVRDSILNLSNENTGDPQATFGAEIISSGIIDSHLSLGELARESNRKIRIEANEYRIVTFNISKATEDEMKDKRKAVWKIFLGILVGITFSVLLISFNNINHK
ncbi:MAG TPA: hypothetical protein VKF42_01945 [Chitinivibrionales bacterium]|jgi:hypothetical protein|nr:hypothetical protein [Chitinivibrionales bacterium]